MCFLQQKLPREVVPELMPRRGPITLAVGNNKKVMSRYSISRADGRIHINSWAQVMEVLPSLKIGDNVMFMLYESTKGLFLFMDTMP